MHVQGLKEKMPCTSCRLYSGKERHDGENMVEPSAGAGAGAGKPVL